MPKNLNGLQSGFVRGDDVNNPSVRTFRGKNQFPQSFHHPSTCRYGEVDLVMVAKCETGDVFPYKMVTDLNTFTLASPLKSGVNMYSGCFKVPLEAIYPRNYDIMLPQQSKGDDVPDDARALLNVSGLSKKLEDIQASATLYSTAGIYPVVATFLREGIHSSGSLFSKCNMHFDSELFYVKKYNKSNSTWESFDDSEYGPLCTYDQYFDDYFIPWLKSKIVDTPVLLRIFDDISRSTYTAYHVVSSPTLDPDYRQITFRRALELMRGGLFDFSGQTNILLYDGFPLPASFLLAPTRVENYNIEPIISYQLCCSHFFTNSRVDFIYSAQLFRESMQAIFQYIGSTDDPYPFPTFMWNGLQYQYDVFSQRIFDELILMLGSPSTRDVAFVFFQNLFTFKESLRYGDYFTGAHPEPIAPGDINTPVVDASVNAIDMTRKLQLTRFLNKVNIIGSRIEDYVRSILGGRLPEAPKDVPVRLSLESYDVGGFEVNNTGDAQLSEDSPNITTTNLRLDESRYMFEAEINEPCWIIAVQYFDAERIYSQTMDRFAFHRNRFDDFIPDMQFIGDQPIYSRELSALGDEDTAYAYQLRYMEYKNRYSYASGGFVSSPLLRTWAFITDNRDGTPAPANITPEYIRSSPSEFDRFYKSLNGYSLGNYYHFITFTTNLLAPFRQMVYAPEILA